MYECNFSRNNIVPKVSVVVPVYNVETYVAECLDSLKNQTLKDIEIICVDDGSTDSSAQICDAYAANDARITVIHKSNTGYGHSINIGIDSAHGKYIGILESDDFADKKMYENLWNLAEEFQADNVRSSWYEYYADRGITINVGTIPYRYTGKVITYKDFPEILKKRVTIWGGIFKKDFLTSNNIRCLETPGASYQDTSFIFKTLTLADRLVLTAKPYVYYRKDNLNSSCKSKSKVYFICDEYNEINNFLNTHPEIKQVINYRKLIDEYDNYIWNLLRITEDVRPEFIEKMSEIFDRYYRNGELDSKFYRRVNKKEFLALINDKEKFLKIIRKKSEKRKSREKRKLHFSLKIRRAGISLVFFGKQVLNVQF